MKAVNIDEFDAFAAAYQPARARATDPQTSHDAAASVRLRQTHVTVYQLLRQGACTDEQLIARARSHLTLIQMSDSGIRSRRAELVRAGWARDTGQRGVTVAGRPTTIWEVILRER